MKGRAINNYHPLVPFVYLLALATLTMLTLNPVVLALSLIGGFAYSALITGVKETIKTLTYLLPLFVLVTALNALTIHKGESALFFINNSPITKEAIIYGGCAGAMIIAAFYWFRCFSLIITSTKIIYLMGRILPRLAILFSMTLSFLPRLKQKYKAIISTQRAMGMYSRGGITDKVLSRFRAIVALIGYSLENSIDTADSMRARGYGLKGRTSILSYKWRIRDSLLMSLSLIITTLSIVLLIRGGAVVFYPRFLGIKGGIDSIACYCILAFLVALPSILEIWEGIKWRILTSKI